MAAAIQKASAELTEARSEVQTEGMRADELTILERDRRELLKLLQREKVALTLSVAERQAQLDAARAGSWRTPRERPMSAPRGCSRSWRPQRRATRKRGRAADGPRRAAGELRERGAPRRRGRGAERRRSRLLQAATEEHR